MSENPIATMIIGLADARDILIALAEEHSHRARCSGQRPLYDTYTLKRAVCVIDDIAEYLHGLQSVATRCDRSAITRDWKLADMMRGLDTAHGTVGAMWDELAAYRNDIGDDVDDAVHVIDEAAEFLNNLRLSLHQIPT
jgi:hypothetical protein